MPAYDCRLPDDTEATRCESRDMTAKTAAQQYCDAIVDRARVISTTVTVVEVDGDYEDGGIQFVVDGGVAGRLAEVIGWISSAR